MRVQLSVITVMSTIAVWPLYSQQTGPSKDATTVRALYQKLEMASRMSAARDRIYGTADPASLSSNMRLEVSDVETGPVSDITNRPLESLVTKPSGNVFLTKPEDWEFTDRFGGITRTLLLSGHWVTAPYLEEDWKRIPMSLVFNELDAEIDRYAAFTVRLTAEGIERQYMAMLLFGMDAAGQEIEIPLDNVLGSSTVAAFLRTAVRPTPFVAGFANHPVTQELIVALGAPFSCEPEPVTGLCCDTHSVCGWANDDFLISSTSVPLHMSLLVADRPDSPLNSNSTGSCSSLNTTGNRDTQQQIDTHGHITGSHGGTAVFQGTCTYQQVTNACSSDCLPTCHVSTSASSSWENGILGLGQFCHVTAFSGSSADSQSHGGSCNAGVAVGVSNCLGCACAISFSKGGVSISSSGTFV